LIDAIAETLVGDIQNGNEPAGAYEVDDSGGHCAGAGRLPSDCGSTRATHDGTAGICSSAAIIPAKSSPRGGIEQV
jgi:hypothetical protein